MPNSHHAQEVAHLNVDNPVDTSLQVMPTERYSQVRKKLRSAAQLLAHFSGLFPPLSLDK